MGMIVYLFRRRRNRSRLNTKGNLLTSAEDATSESQNSMEKLKVASRTTQGVPTWEDFLKEVEREYERFDESEMSSEGSVFSIGGYRATTAELEKRYNRLWSNTNRSPIKAGSNSSDTMVASPAGSSPLPLISSKWNPSRKQQGPCAGSLSRF